MNIAFPIILIIFIVLPGILFNFFRQSDPEFKIPLKLDNIQNEIAKGFFFAIILHVFGFLIHFSAQLCTNYFLSFFGSTHDIPKWLFSLVPDIDFRTVTVLLTGTVAETNSVEETLKSVYNYPIQIALYFIMINVLGIGLGKLYFKLVRHFKLDHKYPIFRFDNPWFYLLSGEKAFFDDNIDSNGMDSDSFTTPDRYVSIIIDQGNHSYLYRGLLRDYYLDKHGGLDKLVLSETHRRVLSDDKKDQDKESQTSSKKDDKRYYDVEGDYFIIESSMIKNINIEYLVIDIDEVSLGEAGDDIVKISDGELPEDIFVEQENETEQNGE